MINYKYPTTIRTIAIFAMVWLCNAFSYAQEFKAKFTINHNAVQIADQGIFDKLKETLEEFFNNRQSPVQGERAYKR